MVITLVFAPWSPGFADSCGEKCQEENIGRYFGRIDRVFRAGSSVEDINELFKLFHADVRYQHLEYGADFGFGDWKSAFLGNLKAGAYNHSGLDEIKVTRIIHGKSHAAVGYRYGSRDVQGQWSSKEDKELLVLFGFRDNKIVLVREYW